MAQCDSIRCGSIRYSMGILPVCFFVVVVVVVVDLEKTLARRVEHLNGYLGKLTSF